MTLEQSQKPDRSLSAVARKVVATNAPEYLINGLVPCGGIGILIGAPEAGKTYVGLDWLFAAATGTPAMGKFPVARPMRVAFIHEDNLSEAKLIERLRAIKASRGIKDNSYEERFSVQLRTGLKLDTEPGRDAHHVFVREEKPELMFYDTLASLTVGKEDVTTFKTVFDAIRTAQAIHPFTAIVTHHPLKAATTETELWKVARGSGSFHASASWGYFVERVKPGKFRATAAKGPDWNLPTFEWGFKDGAPMWKMDCNAKWSEEQREKYGMVIDFVTEQCAVLESDGARPDDLALWSGGIISKRQAPVVMREMVAEGMLTLKRGPHNRYGYWLRDA